MRFPFSTTLLLTTFLLTTALTAQGKDAKTTVDFEKQIWPILEKNCVECHKVEHVGPDGKKKKPKGGVVFETKEGMVSSKKGKLVVAKKPDDSLIYAAITLAADHEDRMPPAKKGDPLPKEQTDLIKQWIEEGAAFGTWTGKKADDKGKDKESGDKPKGKDADKPKGKGEGEQPPTGG